MVGLELQRGKEGMKEGEYCGTLGATAAYTLRLTELALDGNSECGIMGDVWFGSVKAAVALLKKGFKSILQVKTGHDLFPKILLMIHFRTHLEVCGLSLYPFTNRYLFVQSDTGTVHEPLKILEEQPTAIHTR
jgi:hypothetical protein